VGFSLAFRRVVIGTADHTAAMASVTLCDPTTCSPPLWNWNRHRGILGSARPPWLKTQPRPGKGRTKVPFDCAPRNENGNIVKEKLVMLFRCLAVFVRTVGRNRQNNDVQELRLKLEWPYIMHSSLAMHRPFVSGTWIWHRQHACWHHGYYRTRR